MNAADWKILNPFLRSMNGVDKTSVELLHTSPVCRSYFVSFENTNHANVPSLVVKVYRQQDRASAIQEVKNLIWAEEVQKRITGYGVKIPEVQWSNAFLGILATRWVPGRNLDTTLRSESRLWSRHNSKEWNIKLLKLIEWLECFSRLDKKHSLANPKDQWDDTNWYKWTTWLAGANQFKQEWRSLVIPELHNLREKVIQKGVDESYQHGDFAPWNVRVDSEGNLYVMDWEDLEKGSWLSPAYRFYFALRIYSLSLLAKPEYFNSIYINIEEFIKTHQPDEKIRRYYRARAVLQYINSMCRRPVRTPKSYMIKRLLINELNDQLVGS
jgi:hypothetical protein